MAENSEGSQGFDGKVISLKDRRQNKTKLSSPESPPVFSENYFISLFKTAENELNNKYSSLLEEKKKSFFVILNTLFFICRDTKIAERIYRNYNLALAEFFSGEHGAKIHILKSGKDFYKQVFVGVLRDIANDYPNLKSFGTEQIRYLFNGKYNSLVDILVAHFVFDLSADL